jgi:hypothetical protein
VPEPNSAARDHAYLGVIAHLTGVGEALVAGTGFFRIFQEWAKEFNDPGR